MERNSTHISSIHAPSLLIRKLKKVKRETLPKISLHQFQIQINHSQLVAQEVNTLPDRQTLIDEINRSASLIKDRCNRNLFSKPIPPNKYSLAQSPSISSRKFLFAKSRINPASKISKSSLNPSALNVRNFQNSHQRNVSSLLNKQFSQFSQF